MIRVCANRKWALLPSVWLKAGLLTHSESGTTVESQTLPYCGIHNVAMGQIKSDMSQSLCGGMRQDCGMELAFMGNSVILKMMA